MYSRGEIWLINLDPTIGAEIKKTRPAIIISSNSVGTLPLRVIVPITEWKPNFSVAPWLYELADDPIHGLSKHSGVDCLQIRSVSNSRFAKKLGDVKADELEAVIYAIGLVIELK